MAERGRVAILISGRGSNMSALVRAMQAGAIPAEPALVLSNEAAAPGLGWAAEQGVPTSVVDHHALKPRRAHEERIVEILREKRVDLVCLAGYMRLLSSFMVAAFPARIFNVHPSLLPAFPGLHAQRQALEHGVKVSGCTVHVVDDQLDHGPIVLQATVPVLENDTEESLSARILEEEHRIYPQAVGLYFEQRLLIRGRRVHLAARAAS